jgi:ribosomal protein S21
MSIRIEPRVDETLAQTVERFTRLVRQEYGRPWTKRRFGYYEKPSALRRKRAKMRRLRARGSGNLYLHIDLDAQLRRTGPTNAAGQ